jgi:hypothetical protein
MRGLSQLSLKYLGYEITKNDRAIVDPRLSDFGSISRALGAMMSFNCISAILYTCSGKIGDTGELFAWLWLFFVRKSSIPINKK